MKTLNMRIFFVFIFFSFFACSPRSATPTSTTGQPTNSSPRVVLEKNGITIREADPSTDFPDATIALLSPDLSQALAAGKHQFHFKVENYALSSQTPDAEHKHVANSKDGQHIHWILNNSPYTAHYQTVIEKELAPGKHLLLSFLSRSYHESIKNGKAHLLKQITVKGKDTADFDLKAPYLFYSRPKGEYKGHEINKLLLDFFLVNTSISENGNKVKVTIDGTEFILSKWVAYFVEGLKPGDHLFRTQLIDNDGKLVPGPFNDSGDRKISLLEH